MAPVEGSGIWPAWIQIVLNRAVSRSFTVRKEYSDIISRRNCRSNHILNHLPLHSGTG